MQTSIRKRLISNTLGMQFYITALNTYDGGPPGIGGHEDAERVTRALLTRCHHLVERKLPFGFMTRLQGIARGLSLMAEFWNKYAQDLWQEREDQRRKKIHLFRLLLEAQVPIPLAGLCGETLSRTLADSGVRTMQDLIEFVEGHKRFPLAETSPTATVGEHDPHWIEPILRRTELEIFLSEFAVLPRRHLINQPKEL